VNLSALQTGCARVVIPAECEVVHEPDTLLVTYERSDLKSAETSHNWRKVNALELAAPLGRTWRNGDILLKGEKLIASEASVSVTRDFHPAAAGSRVVATKIGTVCIEPECSDGDIV